MKNERTRLFLKIQLRNVLVCSLPAPHIPEYETSSKP